MTRDEIAESTRDALAATEAITAHLDRLRARLANSFPLEPAVLVTWGDDERERLHAFLRMFEQSYDLISRQLFRGALALSGEDPASLSAQNLFRRLEKLGAIENASAWLELSTTGNMLIHEYPIDAVKQAALANRAWRELPRLLSTARSIIGFIRSEDLLGG